MPIDERCGDMSDKKYVGPNAAAKLVALVKSALNGKADKTNATSSVAGLMSAADKAKLDGIAEGATKITVDSEMSASSANPVMNGTITVKLSSKADKTDLSGKLDKAGGTITGNLTVNGDFEPVKGLTTSGGVYAQTVSTPVLDLHDNGTAGANASINVSGVGAVEVTVPDGDKRAKARLKIGTPTEDDDAATAGYVKAAIPTALKNPNALTIKIGDTTITYDGSESKTVTIPSRDNIIHADIPDYIKTAALEVAKKVQAVRTSESIVFIAASDAHQLDTSANIVNGNLHAGMAMKALTYILPGIDFACYLGDYTAGSATTTLAEGRQHFAEINADIDEAFSGIPQFRTLGNHDSLQYSKAQNGSVLPAAELYGLCGAYNTGAVMGSTTEGYCYRDFESKKLRVICLNTAENSEKEYVSDAQKLWFANTLKAVGVKTGWNVLILSHHPLDWGGVCILSNIVKAYVDGGSITVSSGNTVNFSGSNSATILASIHGHVHCFKAAKLNAIASGTGTEYNVWRVATPNMCFARNNEYGQNGNAEYYGIEFGETTTYNKTANSANDTAFVVNVVNPSQQKIYSYCYGAGYDREIFTGIQTVAVTGVSLNAASGELTIGGQTTLTATVSPADASNKTVTWESSAPTVASVVNGVVTALAPGSAKITVKTADGGFTAEYALTVKAATSDLLASYGYADNTRLSTSSGSEKAAAGYVTIGHTAAIPIDKTRYPNGATIRVTGAVNCLGNNWSGANNGGDSAFVLYTTGGTTFAEAGYIEAKTTAAGTFTIDSDKTGFTLNIASLSAPHYLKFCVKGTGANLTATLTPK